MTRINYGKVRAAPRAIFTALWMRGTSSQAIGEALGVTDTAVREAARRFGLPARNGRKPSRTLCSEELFRRMWLAGVNSVEIANHFGYSTGAVSHRRIRLGLPPRDRRQRPISLSTFLEAELGRKMKEAA